MSIWIFGNLIIITEDLTGPEASEQLWVMNKQKTAVWKSELGLKKEI